MIFVFHKSTKNLVSIKKPDIKNIGFLCNENIVL